MPNSASATPDHNNRLASKSPESGGSIVLRSAAVQYLVAMLSADRPNGSASATVVSNCGSRRRPRITMYSTSVVTAPTYVHIIDLVAVGSAKNPAETMSKVGSPNANSAYR